MHQNNLVIRRANNSDIPQMLQVEEEAWGKGEEGKYQFTEENLRNLMKNFPMGNIVAEIDGKIKGFINLVMVDSNHILHNECLTWQGVSNNGNGCKVFNGDALYGINLSVACSQNGVSARLMEAAGRLAIELGVKDVFLGSRIPRYHKRKEKITAQEYIQIRSKKGCALDPEIHLYESADLKIVRLIENYFHDPESCDYGVLMCWKNPFYGWPFGWLWKWFFKI